MPLDGKERVRARIQICSLADDLSEADGNDVATTATSREPSFLRYGDIALMPLGASVLPLPVRKLAMNGDQLEELVGDER
jgi:hypothetical protein